MFFNGSHSLSWKFFLDIVVPGHLCSLEFFDYSGLFFLLGLLSCYRSYQFFVLAALFCFEFDISGQLVIVEVVG